MVDFSRISHCALSFNGTNLDKRLKNYMTVNVEGRQLFSPRLNTVEVPGRDGDIVIDKTYPARDIKVYFLMYAENNEEWLKQIKELTNVLQSKEDIWFSFADEEGERHGQLSKFEDPPYDSNIGIGSFTLHCQDPFLYSDIKISSGDMPDLKYSYYNVKIESLAAKISSSCNKVKISNDTKGLHIILNGGFNAGDNLVLYEDGIVRGNTNIVKYIDYLNSDYHNFKIYAKDRISVRVYSGSSVVYAPVHFRYRERIL